MPTTAAPTATRAANPGRSLERLDQLAWLMDRAIPIPGTKFRVGLDAIMGLVPIGGDAASGIIQAGIVLAALFHYKVPKAVAGRMVANVLLDVAVGAVPFLGDAFDAVFKANTRNLALLRQVEEERIRAAEATQATRMSRLYLAGLAGVLILAVGLVIVGFVTVLRWIAGARF